MCQRPHRSRIEYHLPSSPRHHVFTMFSGSGWLFTGLLAAFLVSAAPSSAIGQVLWPGNGHYYLVVNQEATWEQARLLAKSMTFAGVQGHLATVTSADENAFVTTQLGDTAGAWLGGEQPPCSVEPGGGWRWITGEPWAYTTWDEGEPNDTYLGGWGKDATGQSEERLQYHHDGAHWNDVPDDPEVVTPRFIVEWEVAADHSCQGGCSHIRGWVRTEDATGVPDVTLTLDGPDACQETTTTKDPGFYVFPRLQAGTYTVTPSGADCPFEPPSWIVTLEEGGRARVDFAADCP
jgi:hypothetical protein